MVKSLIYKPEGEAAEYTDYALDIYTRCTNSCIYCNTPWDIQNNHEEYEPAQSSDGIIEKLRKQLAGGAYKDRMIHLGLNCDPFPYGTELHATCEAIALIKEAGANVKILTKNPMHALAALMCYRSGLVLDCDDMFGTTITGAPKAWEPNTESNMDRIKALGYAHNAGVGTWVSCEPILDPGAIEWLIKEPLPVDFYVFGKANCLKEGLVPDIDWDAFGRQVDRLCKRLNRNYLIKESLREGTKRRTKRMS